eukprot:gnl/Chilomastix_cuspidata/5658.p1 GENE.gnl/Chilomastix_cuspidata/5658~~gnl/Chilomastix_cuspidata/5658.p1  ORF type:complete len:451 (+),score=61.32 gnl/Chilomastix_cuspidata/5658:69-1421(+)
MKWYFDHNSTTPLDPRVASFLSSLMSDTCTRLGNPSGKHNAAQAARDLLETACADVRYALDCRKSDEIIFTSGATESINAAIVGSVLAFRHLARESGKGMVKPHVMISAIEHRAAISAAAFCRDELDTDVTVVPVDGRGFLSTGALLEGLRPGSTCCVSLILASNEIGTVQTEITDICTRIRQACTPAHYAYLARGDTRFPRFPVVHLDAVQAAGKVELSFAATRADALSVAAHKVGGLAGAGALIIRGDAQLRAEDLPERSAAAGLDLVTYVPLEPLVHGSHQQGGRRAGTESSALVAAFAFALRLRVAERKVTAKHTRACARAFERELRALLRACKLDLHVNGAAGANPPREGSFLPNTLSVTIPGVDAERALADMAAHGIMASAGSSCSNLEEDSSSTVLTAIGTPPALANATFRFSFGMGTSVEDVRAACPIIAAAMARSSAAGPQ